jgi:5-methylcytosine-specific restriction endonuclease McrA
MSKRSRKRKQKRANGSPTWMVSGVIGKGDRTDYQNWNSRGFFSGSAASECKRIDPVTGEVITARVLEAVATDILKTDQRADRQSQKRAGRQKRPVATQKTHTPTVDEKEAFYKSWDWRELRMQVLKMQGRICQCCGATPAAKDMAGNPVRLCVDHIKPLSKFWHLRLDRSNLQILCDECNQGKGNWDQTDFRKPAAPDEWVVDDVGVSDAILAQLTDRTTGRLQ